MNLFREHHKARRPWKQLVADMSLSLYIMVSVRGFTPEPRSRSRSREGGVVTRGKPTTPRDTREQGDTNAQYNSQTTALRSPRLLASGCRRGSSCNAMWCGIALVFNSRRYAGSFKIMFGGFRVMFGGYLCLVNGPNYPTMANRPTYPMVVNRRGKFLIRASAASVASAAREAASAASAASAAREAASVASAAKAASVAIAITHSQLNCNPTFSQQSAMGRISPSPTRIKKKSKKRPSVNRVLKCPKSEIRRFESEYGRLKSAWLLEVGL